MISKACSWLVLSLIFMVLGSKKSLCFSQETCMSRCGKLSNIRYPFRLKGDPTNCGISMYELECVKDVAMLRLTKDADYKVEAINYKNYTIRLVDSNIEEEDCSSLPSHFLYKFNFSDASDNLFAGKQRDMDDAYHATQMQNSLGVDNAYYTYLDLAPKSLFQHIIYMRCNTSVTEYQREYEFFSSHHRCLDSHTYAVVGDLATKLWKSGCHVKLIAATSARLPSNVSYADIHRSLAYGFELSWLHHYCHQHCKSKTCYFNRTTQNASCFSPCDVLIRISIHCGIQKFFQRFTEDYVFPFIFGGMHSLRSIPRSFVDYSLMMAGKITVNIVGLKVLIGTIIFIVLLTCQWRRRHMSSYANIEIFLQENNNLVPIRYSYREIKKMTKNFKEKLGKGGFGSVYKGKLRSGPFVAIKILDTSKSDGQDFISEITTIGRIHHINVVRPVGFCVEGSKRALVCDFMPNGSLDKYILSKEENISLSYEKIYEISLGIARGISYLHEGCDMQILHFDIKPHNILLDENFIPKVSDFGLAKLYPIDDSIVSLTDRRETIGYIAPEMFYNNIGGVSYKVDVYSFGMLLMEMANRRKNFNPHAENSSSAFFPTWIYNQFSNNRDIELDNITDDEKNIFKKMIIVALWCIQLKPCDRPSMKQVVEMLEGEAEALTMPPKPSLYPGGEEELDLQLDQTSTSHYDSECANSSYLHDNANSNISEDCLSIEESF